MSINMQEDYFKIKGLKGRRLLKGEVSIGGAKNDVLKIMAASILFEDDLIIENVPLVEDVKRMQELLIDLGATVEWLSKNKIKINTKKIRGTELNNDIAKRMRASIVLTGPILARFHEVHFPHPGGCVIGERPIGMFLNVYEGMGAKTTRDKNGTYHIKTPKRLEAQSVFFNKQSVGVTETSIMTSILAKGKSTFKNVALEPEIINLANFLKKCGAKIEGLNTTTISIEGGGLLKAKGKVYKVIPDRIEAGSFIILGALLSNNLKVNNCEPGHMDALLNLLSNAGVKMKIGKNYVHILKNDTSKFKPIEIKTHEYPGFPTDLQAPMTVFLTQINGESSITETIFENRFGYTEDLIKMGAKVNLWNPQKISIEGVTNLKHATLYGPDLRAGLAFIIAGIISGGESKIKNAYFIDRGYENIEEKLSKIGVNIERIKN